MVKTICIDGVEWCLNSNGDCFSSYNVYYNVYTKKSNLKEFPKTTASILKSNYKGVN